MEHLHKETKTPLGISSHLTSKLRSSLKKKNKKLLIYQENIFYKDFLDTQILSNLHLVFIQSFIKKEFLIRLERIVYLRKHLKF